MPAAAAGAIGVAMETDTLLLLGIDDDTADVQDGVKRVEEVENPILLMSELGVKLAIEMG